MSEEEFPVAPPTAPNAKVNEGIINTPKDFSGALTLDLSDEEIQYAWRIIQEVRRSHMFKFRSKFNDADTFTIDDVMAALEEMEDEVVTRLAEGPGVLATVDVVPILEGEPPIIDIIGKVPGSDLHKYGFDHERKEFEVKRAFNREEEFYGEKGPTDGAYKRRDEKSRKN